MTGFIFTHPGCVLSFHFSTPLVPGGISTLPLRHPGNAEEDVYCVFILVATSVADCELDVQTAIKNSIAVEEAVDNRGLYRNACCNICRSNVHVLANDARTMNLKH